MIKHFKLLCCFFLCCRMIKHRWLARRAFMFVTSFKWKNVCLLALHHDDDLLGISLRFDNVLMELCSTKNSQDEEKRRLTVTGNSNSNTHQTKTGKAISPFAVRYLNKVWKMRVERWYKLCKIIRLMRASNERNMNMNMPTGLCFALLCSV